MRTLKLIMTVAVVVAALFACTLENPWSTGTPDSPAALPPDTANDTLRSTDGPFTFATLLPVALDLQVRLYDSSPAARGLESLSAEERLIIATLLDAAGNLVFQGRFGRQGTLRALVALPAVPADITLRLEAPGFQSRSVKIAAMVRYAEIRRIMGLMSDGTGTDLALPDSDGDGVPDVYDADPYDPTVSFINTVPPAGFLTVAFEDQYKVTRAGDADYNDFVAEYRVIQSWLDERISGIQIEALAKRKWAGYNHAFGMTLEFDGAAEVTIERFRSPDATSPFSVKRFSVADGPGVERAVLELFPSTKDAVRPDGSMGHWSVCTILFPEPYLDPTTLSEPPYDPYLYIWNTGYDVHLIGRRSLPRVPHLYPVQRNDPEDLFQDAEGYPWALLVPTSWESPAETQYIGKAYPLFDRWRESFGREAPNWYLYPAGTGEVPDNNPPYPVTSPDGETPRYAAGSTAAQTYRLAYDSPDGSGDPDLGDTAEFRSSLLPAGWALDPISGELRIPAGVSEGQVVLFFWSEDSRRASTIDRWYRVELVFEAAVVNAPPAVSFPGDYEMLSAGNPGVIGRYEITGTNEGRPLYRQVVPLGTEPYYLYYLTAADFGGLAVWALHAAVGTTLSGAQYYNGDGAAPTAPEGSWEAVQAAGSAEGRRLPISGSLNVGGTLRVHYLYTDPDGDSQDVGATGIRWLRYDSATATDGEEIGGAGGESYTTTAADGGRWLRVELTPVDARGGVGEPALSPVVAVSAGG